MSLLKNSLITSAAIFACRMTGMVREIVFLSLFGATGALDAFYTAFRVPNLLRDLFAEGALSQSYTSVASKTKETDGDSATWVLTNRLMTQLSTLMTVIITLGICFAGPLMDLLYGQNSSPANQQLATELSRYMWPFIGLASLAALSMGALNTFGVFGLPMLASAAFNVTSVLTGLLIGYWMDPNFGPDALYGFAIGVTLGGVAQLFVQIPKLRQKGFRFSPNFHWKDEKIRKIWGLTLPAIMASGITQFTVFINTGFAIDLQEGSVTALTTAFRIWQLPVGLFGVATGMVVLPAISRMMVNPAEKQKVPSHIAEALRLVAFFAIPAFAILAILGTEVISTVYQWGAFDSDAVYYTGSVLSAYSIGLLGYAGSKVVQPLFLALEKRWVPLIVASISLCISIGLNYYFVYYLHADASWLALTTSIVTTFNFLFYFGYLRKNLGNMDERNLIPGLLKICLAAIPLALICWVAKSYLFTDFLTWNIFYRGSALVATCALGGISYLGLAYMLRSPELHALKNKLLNRRTKSAG